MSWKPSLFPLFSVLCTPIANPWFGPDPLFLLSGPKEGIKYDFKIKSKWYIWNPIFHPRNIGFGMCLVERAASWDGPTLRRDLWHSSTWYFHVFKSSYSFGGLKESAAPGSVLESSEFSIWSISFPLHSCMHHILDLRRWLRKPASLLFLWEGRTPSMCEPSSPKGALVLLS